MLSNATKTQNDKNLITHYYIKYSFIPSKTDIGATFMCTVMNPALQAQLATSVNVYVTGMCIIDLKGKKQICISIWYLAISMIYHNMSNSVSNGLHFSFIN
jgi:hypothetical protein